MAASARDVRRAGSPLRPTCGESTAGAAGAFRPGLSAGLFGDRLFRRGVSRAQSPAAAFQVGADESLEQFQAAQLLDEDVLRDGAGGLGRRHHLAVVLDEPFVLTPSVTYGPAS
ncbi:hypothetical protein [Streptomyces pseudogriseolus]|uniref:hypothetical protein n=1 Tax=Streptomyces pseudogriseolus TaxID=36817 RepID=UPI003FA27C58